MYQLIGEKEMNASRPTIGLICFGEVNTPIERLKLKHDEALSLLGSICESVVDGGLVIDDPDYSSAMRAIETLKRSQATKDFSSIVVCVAGWIPSHAVIFVTDAFRNVPMLLWGLNGWYENGRLFSTADQAGTTALRSVFEEMGYSYKYVYSIVGKLHPIDSISAFLSAAHARDRLRTARIGTLGWRDMLLYGTCADPSAVRSRIGVDIEPFELLEMSREAESASSAEISDMLSYMKSNWVFSKPCDDSILEKGSRYALAIGKKIKERGYEALSLVDVDGMKKLLGFPPAMIFMLLDHCCDVQLLPENDLIGGIAQLMLKHLTGQDTFYLEYYEFFERSVLAGVPDFIPKVATDGDIVVLPAAFGLLSTSLLNVSKVEQGELTCARLAYIGGKFRLHLYTGEGRKPPSWAEYGWDDPAPQLPSLEIFPNSCTVPELAERVLSQHVICIYGNYASALKDLCTLLDIEVC
jgi:L-fucose isomerase-like protein